MSSQIFATTFTGGPLKHLKRKIKAFLDPRNIRYLLQTTHFKDEKDTFLCMEGPASTLPDIRDELVICLHSEYPEILIADWAETSTKTPILGPRIVLSKPDHISRGSYGFFQALHGPNAPTIQNQVSDEVRRKLFFDIAYALQSGRYDQISTYEQVLYRKVYRRHIQGE